MVRRLPHLMLASALALGALLVLGASVQAAAPRKPNAPTVIFLVNSFLDTPDQSTADNLCLDASGHCSLRAAVQQLDHNSGGVINLLAGTYNLTDTADGDLQLQKDIAIHGLGPGLSVIQGKPGWASRILRVQSGAGVILSSLAISGGHPAAGQPGGGLDVASGSVLLFDSLVVNNQAGYGGGIYNSGALIVDHSLLRQNGALTNGGGLYNASLSVGAYLTMALSQMDDNSAGYEGGGLYNEGHAVILTSTINLNEALGGAGLTNINTGTLSVAGSAILGNQALGGEGGGLAAAGVGDLTQMADTTMGGNSAASQGGGIFLFGGTIQLFNVTVVSNTGNTAHLAPAGAGGGLSGEFGEFDVYNSLVAHNADLEGQAPDCNGVFNIVAYDLVQDTQGCPAFVGATGVITGHDPQLLPLGFYGGQTLTYGLSLTSPAVDAGDPAGCRLGVLLLTIDQRGQPRKVDGNGDGQSRCDMGAYELQLSRAFLPLLWR